MKFSGFAAAAIAATVMVPSAASAAVVVQLDIYATGTITDYYLRDGTTVVRDESRYFSFEQGSWLAIGESQTFQFGATSNGGVATGSITRIADDKYGNQAFTGSNFFYGQQTRPDANWFAQETSLRAGSFTVRQIVPAPVPEPMTWMTMVLGFGVIGYAMRRRKVIFNRLSLV